VIKQFTRIPRSAPPKELDELTAREQDILLLIAGGGIMVGNQLARWFGVVVLGLNLIEQMFSIPAYPFWSLTIIALDVVALYGLCAYGSRENVEAAV